MEGGRRGESGGRRGERGGREGEREEMEGGERAGDLETIGREGSTQQHGAKIRPD